MELTPQQEQFLKNWLDLESDTFGNATQSAIKAGFSESYADNILAIMPEWLKKSIGRYRDSDFLSEIEDGLKDMVRLETISHVKVGDKVVVKQDPALLKIKQDTLKFLAERLIKDRYSTRTEHTGKDGEKLTITFDKAFEE